MKVIIGILLSLVIISSVGFAYSQSDSIPTWIKGVAGYWAEDKITDKEFVEALEFLIESGIIKIADPRVSELEKENSELRQKIESLKSESLSQFMPTKKTQEPETEKSTIEPYIIINKKSYTLGDMIKITAKTVFEPAYGLDGSAIMESETIYIEQVDFGEPWKQKDIVRCDKLLADDHYGHKAGDWTYPLDGTYHKCFDDDGMFEFNYEVLNHHKAGTYYFQLRHFDHNIEVINYAKTEPFEIQ